MKHPNVFPICLLPGDNLNVTVEYQIDRSITIYTQERLEELCRNARKSIVQKKECIRPARFFGLIPAKYRYWEEEVWSL